MNTEGTMKRNTSMIKKIFSTNLLVAMGLLLVVSNVNAAVNFQFKKDTGPTYTGTGAYMNDDGTYWNAIDFTTPTTNYTTPATIFSSDGTTESDIRLSLEFDGTTVGSFNTIGGTNSHTELTQAYLYTKTDGLVTFTLTGLAPNTGYLIYLYGSNSGYQNDSASFTINGTTKTIKNSAQAIFSWVAGNNYTVIAATSDATGTITGTMTKGTTVEGVFNGLQVVKRTTTPAVGFQFKKDTGPIYAEIGACTNDNGIYWNTLNFTTPTTNYTAPDTVYASDGTTESRVRLSLAFSGDGTNIGSFNTTSGTHPHNELTQAYLYTKTTGAITFTLSGLVANTDYLIYLYGSNGGYQSDSASFTINGTNATLKNSGQATFSWEIGNNYTVITATADATGSITGTMTKGTTVEGAFNGLQVVGLINAPSATILNIVPFSDTVIELTINSDSPSICYPKCKSNLVTDASWVSVGHSDDGSPPFVETNLTYSTSDGTNFVIYVEAITDQKFFNIGAK